MILSDVRVFINRKPGPRLESVRMFEMDELVFCLPEKKRISISACLSFLATLGPAQLNLYEPASSNRNASYSLQRQDRLYCSTPYGRVSHRRACHQRISQMHVLYSCASYRRV